MKSALSFVVITIGIFCSSLAFSAEEDTLSLYGMGCEALQKNTPVSSVRVRVNDKASFNAVSSISALTDFRNELNEHDFNVLVYYIVDNMLEDVSVRTTTQTDTKICVEMTGYIQKQNLIKAVQETIDAEPFKTKQYRSVKNNPVKKVATPTDAKTDEASMDNIKLDINEVSDKILVYIAPTEFYNDTISETHAKILKEKFADNKYFNLTDDEKKASYIVKSKVLRAKVDPINSSTNRLQMVIAVELDDVVTTKKLATEHQNRFVLFNEEDNEQEVALNLMKKLISNAGEIILSKIEHKEMERGKSGSYLPTVITPSR